MKRKGISMSDLSSMALSLVVLVVVLTVGTKILSTVQTNENQNAGCLASAMNSSCNLVYNITYFGNTALLMFGSWFNILVIVIIATVVIGLLVGYFQRSV